MFTPANPGAQVTYCSRINPVDPRTAISSWGGPEIGMAGAIFTTMQSAGGEGALFAAVRAGFLASVAVALLAALAAFARGKA